MYQSPKKAKRLYFDVIPRQVDDYSTFLEKFPEQDEAKRYANPVWHMHKRQPPAGGLPISFAMLLNLASVVNAEEPSVLWAFIKRYAPEATPEAMPLLAELVEHALAYYQYHPLLDADAPVRSAFGGVTEIHWPNVEDALTALSSRQMREDQGGDSVNFLEPGSVQLLLAQEEVVIAP